jgi:hypothetical protein
MSILSRDGDGLEGCKERMMKKFHNEKFPSKKFVKIVEKKNLKIFSDWESLLSDRYFSSNDDNNNDDDIGSCQLRAE